MSSSLVDDRIQHIFIGTPNPDENNTFSSAYVLNDHLGVKGCVEFQIPSVTSSYTITVSDTEENNDHKTLDVLVYEKGNLLFLIEG